MRASTAISTTTYAVNDMTPGDQVNRAGPPAVARPKGHRDGFQAPQQDAPTRIFLTHVQPGQSRVYPTYRNTNLNYLRPPHSPKDRVTIGAWVRERLLRIRGT